MPILLLLKNYFNKNSLIIVLGIGLIWAAADAYRQRQEVKRIGLVYQNPSIKTVERVIYKEGPVKIVTKIVKEGPKETTEITEERAPTVKTTETGVERKPVPLNQTMIPSRTDRYLLTAGFNRLTADLDGKALFIGYGVKNRLDVQVGGIEHDGFSPWVLATVRF